MIEVAAAMSATGTSIPAPSPVIRSGADRMRGRLGDRGLHLVGVLPAPARRYRQHQPGQRGRTAADPGRAIAADRTAGTSRLRPITG